MSSIDSLRLAWIRGITDCTGERSMTTEKLLVPNRVTVVDCGEDRVRLYAGNRQHLVNYFAHEADRFASAAFESILTGSRSENYPRSVGWLLVRCYYATFFAAHALLRLHGWACARITPPSLIGINKEISVLFPNQQSLKSGLYLIKFLPGGSELDFEKMDSGLGGSHEMLWSLLTPYLNSITTAALLNSSPEHQQFVSMIDSFMQFIKKSGGSNWFTQVRNRVNYAHEYGAWFPYRRSTTDYDRISRAMSGWAGLPEGISVKAGGGELVEFAAACSFLISACCTTIRDLTYRSKANSPFRTSSGRLAPPLVV